MGRGNRVGGNTTFASPVEIFTVTKQTSIAGAQLLETAEDQGRIVLKIQAEGYKRPFKIVFKDHIDELRIWIALSRLKVTPH